MTKSAAAKTKQGAERQALGRQESGRRETREEVGHQDRPGAALALDRRYGAIGISAVAAALRYQSEVKNPAYAPAVHQLDTDSIDAPA